MAFSVIFYTFSKRENSTYRPAGNGTTLSCVLKDTSSIAAPVILADLGTTGRPQWNYAYIPEFNRYYYITDWTWTENRLWEAALNTDILATYRDDIGAATMYVLRSSAESDGSIVDTLYPAKTSCTTLQQIGNSPWIHVTGSDNIDIATGSFIVGYVTKNMPNSSHMYGSVIYSAMRQSALTSLVSALLDDSILRGFSPEDASLALQKSLIDPLSYIKSVIWIPVLYDAIGGAEQQNMNVWDWSLSAPNKILSNDPPYRLNLVSGLPIAKHPLTAARGNYVNTAPYTRLNLDFPPFGNIDIDTTLSANASQIEGRIYIDMVTGAATLRVLIDGVEQGLYSGQAGVQIQLSQVTRDYLGGAVGAVSGIASTVANVLTGNIVGAIASGANGIGNAVNSMIPRQTSTGASGSFIGLARRPVLYHQFMDIVDDDNEHSGRPLCANRRISTIPGYIKVKDGEIDIAGFDGEAEAVRSYLEAGFFYG